MKINIVYQKALIRTFHTSFLIHSNFSEFTALQHKFKSNFVLQNPVLNRCFKDFWYTKINLTHIWYKHQKVKKSQYTQHEFLTFNNHLLNSSKQI